VEDVVDALARRGHSVLVENIGLAEFDFATDLFDVARVAGRKIVDTANRSSFCKEGAGDTGTDEA
jgi:hypothetical protein